MTVKELCTPWTPERISRALRAPFSRYIIPANVSRMETSPFTLSPRPISWQTSVRNSYPRLVFVILGFVRPTISYFQSTAAQRDGRWWHVFEMSFEAKVKRIPRDNESQHETGAWPSAETIPLNSITAKSTSLTLKTTEDFSQTSWSLTGGPRGTPSVPYYSRSGPLMNFNAICQDPFGMLFNFKADIFVGLLDIFPTSLNCVILYVDLT